MDQLHRMPLPGDRVHCPSDRGDAPYEGTITFLDKTINTNIHGVPYVWCTVRPLPYSHKKVGGVWPSHRLGYNIEGLES